nr:MAG TPA: Minor capsid protein [Caudoviricetes sp.]
MEKYVPMLHTDASTNLRSMSFVNSDGTSINYNAVYARAQFYGFVGRAPGHRVHNYTTPGTSRRWDLRLKGNKHDMVLVKEAFVKGAQWNGS